MITTDGKVVNLVIEGGLLVISVDSNKDGQPLIKVSIDLLEVPDELVELIKKKK